jgi:pyridoxamine 5'-phosphate oxidase
MDISSIRINYSQKTLDITDVLTEPMAQFEVWLKEAIAAEALEPTAMVLSTVHEQVPSSRVVLLKDLKEGGFVFFTNYDSKKGQDMANTQYAALNFFWPELERQVRIVGKVKKCSQELSDGYFHSRPANSRVGAWTSPQSSVIADRQWLEDREAYFKKQFADNAIPRPENWGGYVVEPFEIEFWQGRPSRLHDRLKYRLENNQWIIERLAP